MKCLQNALKTEVRRVSENNVAELIKKGWIFVPKSIWKQDPKTTWVKSTTPPNPTSQKKMRRWEMRNVRPLV